jgi:cyanophycinase
MRLPDTIPLLALALGSAMTLTPPTTTGPARGALMLVGGGANRPSFIQKFVALAGGPNATVVLIPTTLEDARLTPDGLNRLRDSMANILGVQRLIVLHTRDRHQADSPAFVEPLRHATGVWVLGGSEQYVMDAYTGTRTQTEIAAVLVRGGVVGGTSAGAIIQGSATVLADSPAFKALVIDTKHTPFGLLPNTIVLPHWSQRSLQRVLSTTLATAPNLLGIGIDEATAAVVQQDQLDVLGDGHVGIYDGTDHNGKPYYDLSPGQRFDLTKRVVITTPATAVHHERQPLD